MCKYGQWSVVDLHLKAAPVNVWPLVDCLRHSHCHVAVTKGPNIVAHVEWGLTKKRRTVGPVFLSLFALAPFWCLVHHLSSCAHWPS